MPIYEFRCLNCDEIFEVIFLSSGEEKEMKCSHCGATDMERVMSVSSHVIGSPSSRPQPNVSTKTCSTGSCSTIEIPGHGD
ncbi:MAG: zinc ribbon domain-containing protein [Proteobacteria bacterium]|nr:zinc ribbon domain-containing protein [Pseudomonadota bacterium]